MTAEVFPNSRISPTVSTVAGSCETGDSDFRPPRKYGGVAPAFHAAGLNARFDRMLEHVNAACLPGRLLSPSLSSRGTKRKRSSSSTSGCSESAPAPQAAAYNAFEGDRPEGRIRILKRQKITQNSPRCVLDGKDDDVLSNPRSSLPDWLAQTFSTLEPRHPLRILASSPKHSHGSERLNSPTNSVHHEMHERGLAGSEEQRSLAGLPIATKSHRLLKSGYHALDDAQSNNIPEDHVFAFSLPVVLTTYASTAENSACTDHISVDVSKEPATASEATDCCDTRAQDLNQATAALENIQKMSPISRPFSTPGPNFYPNAASSVISPLLTPFPLQETREASASATHELDSMNDNDLLSFSTTDTLTQRCLTGLNMTPPHSPERQSLEPSSRPSRVHIDFHFAKAPEVVSPAFEKIYAGCPSIYLNQSVGRDSEEFEGAPGETSRGPEATAVESDHLRQHAERRTETEEDDTGSAPALDSEDLSFFPLPFSVESRQSVELGDRVSVHANEGDVRLKEGAPPIVDYGTSSTIYRHTRELFTTDTSTKGRVQVESEDGGKDLDDDYDSELDAGSDKENEKPQSAKDHLVNHPQNDTWIIREMAAKTLKSDYILSDDSGIDLQEDFKARPQETSGIKPPPGHMQGQPPVVRVVRRRGHDNALCSSQFSDDTIESWSIVDTLSADAN